MHFGNVELVWPGLFWAVPTLCLLIVMPSVLIFSLFKYTSMSKWKKLSLAPVCVLGPLLATCVWPLIISLSGSVRISDSGGSRRADWQTTVDLFGDYSIYVWTAVTCFSVYMIYMSIRSSHKRMTTGTALKTQTSSRKPL